MTDFHFKRCQWVWRVSVTFILSAQAGVQIKIRISTPRSFLELPQGGSTNLESIPWILNRLVSVTFILSAQAGVRIKIRISTPRSFLELPQGGSTNLESIPWILNRLNTFKNKVQIGVRIGALSFKSTYKSVNWLIQFKMGVTKKSENKYSGI